VAGKPFLPQGGAVMNTDGFKHFKLHSDSTLKSLKKDELISYIHMLYHNWGACDESYYNVMVYAETLQQKCRWIPVEERLPSPEKYVLVTRKEYLTGDCWIDILRRSEYGNWVCLLGTLAGNVIAWMPLPEAYGGRG
jgi:hypothetical protein